MSMYDDEVAEYDVDEFEDYDEAARSRPRRGFPSLPVPRRGNVTPPNRGRGPDYGASIRKLDDKIGVNARAIKTIENRVNGVASHQARQHKAIEAVRNDVKSLREISTLLPLLTSQKSAMVNGTDVLVPSNDLFSKMLPMLLLSGGGGLMGGTSTSDGGLGGLGLLPILLLAGQK